jgi:hypothetical protein
VSISFQFINDNFFSRENYISKSSAAWGQKLFNYIDLQYISQNINTFITKCNIVLLENIDFRSFFERSDIYILINIHAFQTQLSTSFCLLSAVFSLLSVVYCLHSAVCCLLSALSCLLSVVCSQLSAVCCLRSDLSRPLSAVCYLLFGFCCLLSALRPLLSAVCSLLSVV